MGSATRLWSAAGLALTLLAACSPTTPQAAASPRAEPNADPAAVASPPSPSADTSTEGPRAATDETPPPTDSNEAGTERPSSETPRRCGTDATNEQPIRTDELGSGDRMVRVLNRAHGELQVRLVTENGELALAGTLLIAPGATGVFRVPPGHYRLRYRVQTTCEVLRGSAIRLTGRRAGVEIALKPGPRRSPQDTVSRVREQL